jgi:transposase
LVARSRSLHLALLMLEATDRYELEAARALQAVGLAMALVKPRDARDSARAMGTLEKTDALKKTHALDTRMLAAFARVLHEHPESFFKPLADAELRRLQAWVLRRRRLVRIVTSERLRMRASHAAARPSIERVIKFPKIELGDSDAEMTAHVQQRHAALAQAMASVPSIGTVGEAVLLAELPEFGTLDWRPIAPLVGVASLNLDPGPLPGQWSIWDRRADVRRTLYMDTLTAVRHNAPLKTHC